MLQQDSSNIVRSLENLTNDKTSSKFSNEHLDHQESAHKHGHNFRKRYGWRSFRPDCLQTFNRPVFFLVCLCSIVFGQGLACTGINNTMISSIEKRYGFKLTQIGIFSTLFHVSAGMFVSLVCYFGHRHRPFTLALGCTSICLGLFIITIPHYMISIYEAGVVMETDTCREIANSTYRVSSGCKNTFSDQSRYFSVFIIGYCFVGLGVTPIYSLGYAHLDDIVKRGKNSVYFSLMGGFSTLGPAAGFLLANPMLNIFVDLQQPPDSNLTPKDRNWVGAWWIGYLVGIGIILFPIIPMLGFPPAFPDAEKLRKEKNNIVDTLQENEDLKHDFKSLWPSTKSLIKNIPFVCLCLTGASESMIIGGLAIFLPKLIETQFHITAAKSALFTGVIVIPGAAGGMFLGGFLCKKFDWNCRQTLRNASIVAFTAAIFSTFLLIGCDGRNVVGGDASYHNTSSINGLNDACNINCQCSTRYYKPVCSVKDQLTYYSACHAGCSSNDSITIGDEKTFYNCTCVLNGSEIQDGRCIPSCKLFPLFIVMGFLAMLFTFMNSVPLLNSLFRVVPEGQGSFAMGLQHMTVRFLGFIPAPTLFGRLIDESCKLWHRDECTGETTSCLEYKNEDFRNYIFILSLVFKLLSLIFIIGAYKTYKLPTAKSRESINKFLKSNENELQEISLKETTKTNN